MDSSNKILQDLLKFAVQQQDPDGHNDTTDLQLDPEKKTFLEGVLKSMTVNVMDEILTALQMLEKSTKDEEKIEYLNVIRDYIDNIDIANNFAKIGGTNIILKCTKNKSDSVRANAYNILAELAQNNPYCQEHLLKSNLMKELISALQTENENVLASCLYSLTSLTSSYEPAAIEFIQCGGASAVLPCLRSKCSRAFTKACFFISSLSSQFSSIRDEFLQLKAFEALASNLEIVSDFDIRTEALLRAMAALSKFEKLTLDTTFKQHINNDLQSIIDNTRGLQQCEEMIEYSESILTDLK